MLTHRPLNPAEAVTLHEELKTTPNILGYTKPELLRFQDVWVATEDGAFAGACISKNLLFNWTDIAVLYVLPAFRGRGLARTLYAAAYQRADERGRHIYTLSCSPEIIHLMQDFGLSPEPPWKAPFAIHWHMNCHMSSTYRWRESFRKSATMKRVASLTGGTRRHPSR